MDKKSNLIPGIHNYCDRWCERCLFSSRCGVYEKTSDLPPEMLDIHNKAFWNNLVRNFQKTIDLIKEMAAARGIDLTNLSGEVEQKVQQKMGKKDFKDHPLSKLSWDYSTIAIKWLNEFPSMKENELKQSVALGMLTQKEAKHQTTFISDCLAIIEWYLYFIHAKLGRAVIGKARDDQKKAETGFQRDFDG